MESVNTTESSRSSSASAAPHPPAHIGQLRPDSRQRVLRPLHGNHLHGSHARSGANAGKQQAKTERPASPQKQDEAPAFPAHALVRSAHGLAFAADKEQASPRRRPPLSQRTKASVSPDHAVLAFVVRCASK